MVARRFSTATGICNSMLRAKSRISFIVNLDKSDADKNDIINNLNPFQPSKEEKQYKKNILDTCASKNSSNVQNMSIQLYKGIMEKYVAKVE
jgi:hypothetical protein